MFRIDHVAKLEQLKEALEGPGAAQFIAAIDEIVADLKRPCPHAGLLLDLAAALLTPEFLSGKFSMLHLEPLLARLRDATKVDDGAREAVQEPCEMGDSCLAFHGTPAMIGLDEAIRIRPRMYLGYLVPLLLGLRVRTASSMPEFDHRNERDFNLDLVIDQHGIITEVCVRDGLAGDWVGKLPDEVKTGS